ncbi:ABC transporter ATP-binding protein [Natrarchaeobius halalkaliphilus]|uniref:Molybdate/tungstate import ATP-binding protein WtpC n=1 Tax=Natrarchaeobius halalkaliphilus TaxID=1679091 RepID=A0A3N6LXE9_9EURY|nr:ABC transporter ATP-binding protein [Natrarchaeobius halalkaliphilus]RQG86721.1 ABC transporter ATP-binding protein [Natrarchaeobius halalkaliphilus]
MSQIELRDVEKVYNSEVVAVDGVTATIESGEFVSILGPSGCGKSTLLFMIGGFIERTDGDILVEGETVHEPGPDRGMVFQESVLYPWLTVEDNIGWGLKIQGVPRDERREAVQEFISMIGLEGFEEAYPSELSGGMQQRAAMARVLVSNPNVLLMDEPFGALDAQTREVMQNELLDIWQRTGQTCVFVTHSIDEALFLSDRVLVLTARPASIKLEVDLTEFERPRDSSLKQSEAFRSRREEVWQTLQEEVAIAEP